MKKSELLAFLNEIGATPKKGLSQNFLIDDNIIDKIIALAEVKPGDRVLEIGPGPGAITNKLLAASAIVTGIEKDQAFPKREENLTLYFDDVLKFPFEKLQGPLKVVSNIPYHITAPILEKLCKHASLFQSFTLVVQKEVAEKIQAKPRSKQYGPLTLMIQFYTKVAGSFPVPATCFYPAPAIDSTVIRLDVQTPPAIDPEQFFTIVKKAFQQRRKTLSTSLKNLNRPIASILESMNLSSKARPEELSLSEWLLFIEKI